MRSRFFAVVGAVALVVLLSAAPSWAAISFTNFQLGDLPSELCPDLSSPCQNAAAEPAIRADGFGNFFGSSENGLGAGTEAWRSSDGGRHYVHLPSPNQLSSPIAGLPADEPLSPAGGDTDLATASAKNSFGIYNVYVASLELSSVDVSSSKDGGHTWSQQPASTHSLGDDREWIAADGASKVCISYHDSIQSIQVDCSYDAASTFTQPSQALDTAHLFQAGNNGIGNIAIDQRSNLSDPARNNDRVYEIYAGCPTVAEVPTCTTDSNYHGVYMAVSTDGGRTFTDHTIYVSPNATISFAHQFPNVSVDSGGNLHAFYSDDHHLYYSYSRDHGTTWKGPYQIDKAPSSTSIFPWSTAGDAGKVDVVWYGTSYFNSSQTPDSYPNTAAWYAYFSQNLSTFSHPTAWTQTRATPIVHFGGVCESGIGCTGNRDLFDDFGVAASPRTGLASIIYSDDQYDQYNHTLTYPSNCTQADNNTSNCDHTSIATQLGGSGIIGGGGGQPPSGGSSHCSDRDDANSAKAESAALLAINALRAGANARPLTADSRLSTEARRHSCDEDEHGDRDERGSDGSLPRDRVKAAGINLPNVAEVLGLGRGASWTAALGDIANQLQGDAQTRAKLVDPAYSSVGVGVVYTKSGVMWLTADLAG